MNFLLVAFSALTLLVTWLGGRKAIWPVKTEWWDADVSICADLHMTQLIPLPLTISGCSKSRLVTFPVLAHPGSPIHSSGGRKKVVVVR